MPCFTTSMPLGWSTSVLPRNWKNHKNLNLVVLLGRDEQKPLVREVQVLGVEPAE